MRPTKAALSLLCCVSLCGCPAITGAAGDRPEGLRLVQGRVEISEEGMVGRQVTGLQMAAVSVRGAPDDASADLFVSDVFDLSNPEFVIAVDSTVAFSLLLQIPAASTTQPGAYLGALRFSSGNSQGETSLIPAGSVDLRLGTLRSSEGDRGTAGDDRLDANSAQNPLSQMDTDQDGETNLVDSDDDADGISDATDTDVAGDGVDDVLQTLQALPDANADGVPDPFQESF